MAEHAGHIQRLLDYWIEGKAFTAKEEVHIRSCAACRKGLRDFLALEEGMHREAQAARQSCPPPEVMGALMQGEASPAIWKRHVEGCPYCQLDLEDARRAGLLVPAESAGAQNWMGSLRDYLDSARDFMGTLATAPVPAYQAAGMQSAPVDWLSEGAQEVRVGPCALRFTREGTLWIIETSPWPPDGQVLLRLSKGKLRLAITLDAVRQEVPVSLWTSALAEYKPATEAPGKDES